jgi:CheY-like chemotaxis protein
MMTTKTTPVRLLIVEDDPDNLEALSVFLEGRYRVFGYTSPAEALQAVGAIKPDVLLLDIGLGPVDGVQCLKAIRAMPGSNHVPAVAFTGFGSDTDRQAFLAAGFQAVVVKPMFDPEDLAAVIDATLSASATSGGDGTPLNAAGRLAS